MISRVRTKKPAAVAPLLPLTFLVGYQADLAYGSKVARIRAEAENILQYERDLTDMPGGLPSLATIDAGRIKAQVSAAQTKKFNNADRKRKTIFLGDFCRKKKSIMQPHPGGRTFLAKEFGVNCV